MAIDWTRLKSTLANSKLQAENNALYQTILGLISAAQEEQGSVDGDFSSVNEAIQEVSARSIYIVEVDTSGGPESFSLSEYVIPSRGFVIFKDQSGNAGGNNITLTGTVEGTVNPVISTNFGTYKVYLGSDELFHTW